MQFPNWYCVEENGVKLYKAWHLHASELVSHGFSTRIGGNSAAPYDTLNLSLNVDDDGDAVRANRRVFASAIGVDFERIVVPDQVHSNSVKLITEADCGSGSLDHINAIHGTDALITNVPGVTLALHFADCVCIFLLDPVNRAIGVAHAGWRGTAGKIVSVTLDAMHNEFGSEPSSMLAAISPAICRNCYEVGPDTARQIFRAFPHDERVLSQSSLDKWRADLKTANFILLREAGITMENIAVSEECTSCNAEHFFSYRRDGRTGRMGGWMSLV